MHNSNFCKIIGHRGAAGLVFENTLESFQKAMELGADGIELDVWQTTDGEIVVFHDAYLDRLTHEKGFMAEMSYEQLKQIPLKNGAKIPRLSEVIELVKPAKIPLLVEVKSEKAFNRTFDILHANLDFSAFSIGSFYHSQVMLLKEKHPELHTAIMLEAVPVMFDKYLEKVDPDLVVAAIETHNDYLVNTVQAQNRQLFFYTVNLEAEITMALAARPNGIITNFPDRLISRIRNNALGF